MKSSLAVVAMLCVVIVFAAPDAQACWSDNGAAYLGWAGDLNGDLNDFGMLFLDSHPNAVQCSDSDIAYRLTTKLNAMPLSAFDDWLVGGDIALAFAAAMQLGPNGAITPELDAALARAGKNYVMVLDTVNGGCGFDNGLWANGNTCQEDRLVGASAYAWIAAYYRKSGRPWTAKRDAAITQIQQAFSNPDSVCRHNPDPNAPFDPSRGACNGSSTDPIVSLNHSSETPAYGLGQITSLSVALIGLDAAANPWSTNTYLNASQQSVIAGMWAEGSAKANASTGVFENECYNVFAWQEPPTNPCNDMHGSPKYEAYRFPVWWAFERYGLPGRAPGGYQWQLSNGTYVNLADRGEFFGAARYAYYHILTKAYNDPYEPDPYGWPRPWAFTAGPNYYMGAKLGAYWVTAENNGGGALNANRTSQDAWESFYLKDINAGELNSGDTVSIRTTANWYWSATNGGGSTLYANQTAAITWEVFTIVKRNGTGRIHDGDTFSLKTYNNVNYVNGVAGGALSASGTSLANAATFTFKHVNDY